MSKRAPGIDWTVNSPGNEGNAKITRLSVGSSNFSEINYNLHKKEVLKFIQVRQDILSKMTYIFWVLRWYISPSSAEARIFQKERGQLHQQPSVITLRPRQNGRHFPDDLFKCIFLNENVWISIKISQKFVPKCATDNIPALVQIMAWRRLGDKPLSEPMIVRLPTHICITRPQWVNPNIRGPKYSAST